MDCANAKQTWRTFHHKHPALRVVVIAREPPILEDVEYVPVPIKVSALEAALERAAAARIAAMRAKRTTSTRSNKTLRTGSRPVVTARIRRCTGGVRMLPAINHDVYFQPGGYLLGHLRHAMATQGGKAFLLQHDDAVIATDTSHRRVFVNFPPTRLPDLAAVERPAATRPAVTELDSLDPDAPIPDGGCVYEQALDRFLWHLAVATARGRVVEGTPLDAPVYLRRWPNFTRLQPSDDAMRIAAVWVQQPRSLLNLYETLKVPVENVFTFFTAAQAIGLAGLARRESDALIEPAVANPSPYGNLINAVFNRFVRAGKTGCEP